jgi:hypothetical protein
MGNKLAKEQQKEEKAKQDASAATSSGSDKGATHHLASTFLAALIIKLTNFCFIFSHRCEEGQSRSIEDHRRYCGSAGRLLPFQQQISDYRLRFAEGEHRPGSLSLGLVILKI